MATNGPRIQKLPAPGPHLMWSTEIGNIHDRKYRHTFESQTFYWTRPAKAGSLRVKAEIPAGARLTFEVRSAAVKDGLRSQKWRPIEDGKLTVGPKDQCLQYRGMFHSDNGDRYPILDRVEIVMQD